MDTSISIIAHALGEAEKTKDPKAKFSYVLADVMNIHGENADQEAAFQLVSLFRRLEKEIRECDLNEEQMQAALKRLNAFSGIVEMTQLTQTIEQAKKGFLSASTLLQLLHLQNELRGKLPVIGVKEETVKAATTQFEDVLSTIQGSGLPPEMAKLLTKRTEQILAVLSAHRFFDQSVLETAINALLGDLIMARASSETDRDSNLCDKLKDIVAKTFGGAVVVHTAYSMAKDGYELSQQAMSYIEHLT